MLVLFLPFENWGEPTIYLLMQSLDFLYFVENTLLIRAIMKDFTGEPIELMAIC